MSQEGKTLRETSQATPFLSLFVLIGRCIKPNDQLVPAKFNHVRIAEQLRNAGVLEVVRVARAGFPVRLGIQEFIDRYGVLAPMVVETAYRNCAQVGRREG